MFEVSEKFKNAVRQNTRKYEWSGTITTKNGTEYTFASKDIVKGSGYIKWQCCSNTEIELGTVYAAEMGISLYSDIDRYTLLDASVRLYYSLTLSDGTVETIPMGVFEVSEANRAVRTLEIKAYDYMLRFEKSLNLEASSGTPYQFLKAACDACKVELAQSVAEINSLPNGPVTFAIYEDNDIETYRDLLFYTAQVLGCFCQVNRYGKLVLKQYGSKSVWTIPQKERFDSSYSDFVTRYTAISSTNQITQTAEYIAMEKDDALTMNLGINPLMQFGVKSAREKRLRAILTELQNVNYVPFDSNTIGNPALEVGDVIGFSGGHADETKISCITSIELKINGKMALKRVGKNPRLASAKSKNDKNISGLINSVESGKTVVYNFMNVSGYVVGHSLTKVMDINFTATEDTTAAFQCEMLCEVIKDDEAQKTESAENAETQTEPAYPELSIVYKLNDDPVNFMPKQTCLYGNHIVTLYLPVSKIIENSANTFSMYVKLSDGTLKIGESQIRASLSGQGLAAGTGEWNGRINVNDSISRIDITGVSLVMDRFNDSASVTFPSKNVPGFTQSIGNIAIGGAALAIDAFTERIWTAEILRTFVLSSLRGKPQYNNYVTLNTNDSFMLRNRYSQNSNPVSMNHGYAEKIQPDLSYFDRVDGVKISAFNPGERPNFVITTKSTDAEVPGTVDTTNDCFELKAVTQVVQTGVQAEIDEGYLENTTIDISVVSGVKGVKLQYEL